MFVGIPRSEPATFALRHHCQHQPELQITPIEKIRLALNSRDELPPLLAGLQWLWMHPTLKAEILALLDDELLHQINARIAAAGREVFAKKVGAPLAALEIKVDTGVLETDMHFPTGLNLLWDAGRQCVDLLEQLRAQPGVAVPGWRKARAWRRQLKACERAASQTVYRGGPNKEARVKAIVREYLRVGGELAAKVHTSLLGLCDQPVSLARWEQLEYFHRMLDKHRDLAQRRLLQDERIPHAEKVFSLFEPHTEWIAKGKQRPNVELGHRFLIATDQHQLIQDYDLPVDQADVAQSVPVTDRLLGRYDVGSLASVSFDKGFSDMADWELLSLYVPLVVMSKRGRKSAVETQRETEPPFVARRRAHRAVESQINSLEHHGLNRCRDTGLDGIPPVCGSGRAELQPAPDRAGTAATAGGGEQRAPDAAFVGLKPSTLDPAKTDRRSVGVARTIG